MPRQQCQCRKEVDELRCTRQISDKPGSNIHYCWQHQYCNFNISDSNPSTPIEFELPSTSIAVQAPVSKPSLDHTLDLYLQQAEYRKQSNSIAKRLVQQAKELYQQSAKETTIIKSQAMLIHSSAMIINTQNMLQDVPMISIGQQLTQSKSKISSETIDKIKQEIQKYESWIIKVIANLTQLTLEAKTHSHILAIADQLAICEGHELSNLKLISKSVAQFKP